MRTLAAALTLSSLGLAQGAGVIEAAFRGAAVVIDGDLSEWRGRQPDLVLDQASQVWSRSSWNGADDLSAEIFVAYDRAQLYVAGRVRDNDVHLRGARFNEQDAVEVFLDLAPPPVDAGPAPIQLDGNSIQLLVMPLHPRRRWVVIDWEKSVDEYSTLVRPGFHGVRVETRVGRDHYTFELSIPFSNLPRGAEPLESIGFHLAVDDWDAGSERYQYVTWDGANPTRDKRSFGRLWFRGPAPMSIEAPGVSRLTRWLDDYGNYLVVPLSVGLFAVVLSWLWLRAGRGGTFGRAALRVTGLVTLAVGLWLPTWLEDARRAHFEREVARVADHLREDLPAVEGGLLGSYRGGERDRPLVELLAGKTIAREQKFSYQLLSDLVSAVGPASVPYPGGGFGVRPYWIPLSRDLPADFTFATPLGAGQINVVVARRAPAYGPLLVEASAPTSLDYALTLDGEAGPGPAESASFGPFAASELAAGRGVELAMRTIPLGGAVKGLRLIAHDDDLQLVALTWVSAASDRFEPLNLGDAASGLRGPWPLDAGVSVAPGETRRIEIPARSAPVCSRVFLYYRGTHNAESEDLLPGDVVAEVEVGLADRRLGTVKAEFQHQVSMFYERARFNLHSPRDADPSVREALVWEDDAGENRMTLARELELPEQAKVTSVEFRNLGSYPIRFRSVVFGRKVASVATSVEDSPLEYTPDGAQRLTDGALTTLRARRGGEPAPTEFAVFRGGRLTRSTMTPAAAAAYTNMPKFAQREASAPLHRRAVVDGDDVVYEIYTKLGGEGWGDAFLGVFVRDVGFADFVRWLHQIGVALCALAAPVLLLVFSEALTILNDLRLRLVSVLSVATLVPLGILSLSLLNVLERGHESEVDARMRRAATTAAANVRERGEGLRAAGRAWLDDLVSTFTANGAGAVEADAARSALAPLVESQMPPAWKGNGGCLEFWFTPRPGVDTAAFSVMVGRRDLRDTPQWTEPSVFVTPGGPVLGVRCERELPGIGTCSLSVTRQLGTDALADLAPGMGIVLCDLTGYPLVAAAAGGASADVLAAQSSRPATILERQAVTTEVLDSGQPVVRVHRGGAAGWVAAHEVLRDVHETPRMLLAVVDRYHEPALPLDVGPVPVRVYFAVAGLLLLLLSVFLSFVVTTRISRPIDRLERGARALSRGELDVRIATEEGGQIGRLTRTFNQMAHDLRLRIGDLHMLNRGHQELASTLELDDTIKSALGFFARHSPADQARLLLFDRERRRLEVWGGERSIVERAAVDVDGLLEAAGPISMRLDREREDRVLPRLFPDHRALLALPLVLAGRSRGAVVLLFEAAAPQDVNVDLLWAMAGQTAAAVENARLYQRAVEDLATGAFRPDFFRRRVGRAIAAAQGTGRSVALLGLRVEDGADQQRRLGAVGYGRYLERLVREMREVCGDSAICRAADHELQVLLLDHDRARTDAAIHHVDDCVRVAAELVPGASPRIAVAAVCYPEDAASAEFLFDALGAALHGGAEAVELGLERHGMMLQSGAMQAVMRTVARVAPTDITLLIEGETGVGKEVLTDVIHSLSKRASGPLVKVHCAALPQTLLPSELFGHERGAFTGAVERKIGRFEQADGGTIFLDEIGEISLDIQVQLLRVLQEREIERVGGSRPIPVDVRVVAATNRDIEAMVAAGAFREDLYYRLQGMVVRMPPLRERKSEIPALVEQFRAEAMAAGHTRVEGFTTDAIDELYRRDWPGNIRELRNAVFRAMVLAQGSLVTRADVLGLAAGVTAADPARLDLVRPDSIAQAPAEAPAPPAPGTPTRPDAAAVDGPEVQAGRPSGREPAAAVPAAAVPAAAEQPVPDEAPCPIPGPVPPKLDQLLAFIRARASVTIADCAAVTGVHPRTALRHVNALVERGLVRRIGKRRGARYVPMNAPTNFDMAPASDP